MPARVILLVDDSDVVRLTLAAMLEDQGHTVIEAASIAAARQTLAHPVDAAIVDLHLPDGLGTVLFPDLRARNPDAALILFSGDDARDPVPGADLVLEKGMAPDDLEARLEQAIVARRART